MLSPQEDCTVTWLSTVVVGLKAEGKPPLPRSPFMSQQPTRPPCVQTVAAGPSSCAQPSTSASPPRQTLTPPGLARRVFTATPSSAGSGSMSCCSSASSSGSYAQPAKRSRVAEHTTPVSGHLLARAPSAADGHWQQVYAAGSQPALKPQAPGRNSSSSAANPVVIQLHAVESSNQAQQQLERRRSSWLRLWLSGRQ